MLTAKLLQLSSEFPARLIQARWKAVPMESAYERDSTWDGSSLRVTALGILLNCSGGKSVTHEEILDHKNKREQKGA